jgi:hypothetical protein
MPGKSQGIDREMMPDEMMCPRKKQGITCVVMSHEQILPCKTRHCVMSARFPAENKAPIVPWRMISKSFPAKHKASHVPS